MSKCDACPIEGPCYGERHAFACRMADGSDSERRWLADASGAPSPEPPAPPPSPSPPMFGPEVRRALWLGRLDCLYAGPPDCGCSGSHKCHHLGRDAVLDDCVRCLEG